MPNFLNALSNGHILLLLAFSLLFVLLYLSEVLLSWLMVCGEFIIPYFEVTSLLIPSVIAVITGILSIAYTSEEAKLIVRIGKPLYAILFFCFAFIIIEFIL